MTLYVNAMTSDLKYGTLEVMLGQILDTYREAAKEALATLDLDDALLELGSWRSMVVKNPEDSLDGILADETASNLTHLALDMVYLASKKLEEHPKAAPFRPPKSRPDPWKVER